MAKKSEEKAEKSTLPQPVRSEATPMIVRGGREIQPFGTLLQMPIALSHETRAASVDVLNQLLADTITLRDLYKKHHWQVSGATFFQLHELYDKHYEQQSELVDLLAERVQMLGGVSIAMAHDVAEMTRIARPPRGREDVPAQISRLLEAHEAILALARGGAREAGERGDDGTNDLLVSSVVRSNEMQVWFLSEHLAETRLLAQRGEA